MPRSSEAMHCVSVSVAGLWTSPQAPRVIDSPALEQPVQLEPWLDALDDDTRLALCREKRLVSQLLLDTPVDVIERVQDAERRAWCRVVVPSQRSSLDPRGYPGWIPADQLSASPGCGPADDAVQIVEPISWLHGLTDSPAIKLSFLTRLRRVEPSEAAGDRLWVETSLGRGWVPKRSVGESLAPSAATLETLGRRFTGLRYLWAGNSSFGYDCSGLVHSLFAAVGIALPRDAHDQAETGEAVPLAARRAGDLLFFEKPNDQGELRIDHVALYLGEDRMLHAPTNNARVECRRLSGSQYAAQLCAVRRHLSDRSTG
ncbi:C40 family peptidase [Salinicola rhizosphaerae]|uniref:Gamma-D-glutamyl-L-lysine endopeptidase n=1 Tax=Salinicola rhizosphaerae TaxID=1443141 RepID=A0ABQ3E0F0_9GAMM|nr:C40 family peptidase [Salinicola rhizosphaerae]GHB19570.1 gamma-D-glutamyl-L-lysine endopeptidase [Salinicola rhizosphaerae]